MNGTEISRLAHAINDLRPDWLVSSLTTFINRELARRPYRDAAVALVWVAIDTKPDGTWLSDTPKRVLEAGPWWIAANANGGRATVIAPKREEACTTCGRHQNVCICPTGPTARPPAAGNAEAGVKACRAGLRKDDA